MPKYCTLEYFDFRVALPHTTAAKANPGTATSTSTATATAAATATATFDNESGYIRGVMRDELAWSLLPNLIEH